MIKKYSVKKDGNKKLSDNFCVKEFKCNDGSDVVLIDTELVKILQKIRNHFGKSIVINSAYRNKAYNAKIGGVSNSQHVQGTAADISINGVEPLEIAQYAEYIMPNSGGIGVYNNTKNGKFVHIDVRASRSRWQNYGKEITVKGFDGYMKIKSEVTTPVQAIAVLTDKGIITSPDIWYQGTWTDENFKQLLIKVANYIK